MLVTGNMILDALDFLKERVKALESQFSDSLFRFADEDYKRDPRELMRELQEAQARIARLMELQSAYNLRVEVAVLGEPMTLQRVLQMVASANRAKTLWTQAAEQKSTANRYAYLAASALSRDKEHEYAKAVVPSPEARELADAAARVALAYKQAIRSGNARELDMEVDPALFEVAG